MDKVELVIKIDKDAYEARQHWVTNPKKMIDKVDMAIANGIPLHKGHGGLISVKDAVDNLMEYKEIGIFENYDKLTILGCIDRIKNHVKPIIKEDKEKE